MHTHTHTHTHIYIYICTLTHAYIYIYTAVKCLSSTRTSSSCLRVSSSCSKRLVLSASCAVRAAARRSAAALAARSAVSVRCAALGGRAGVVLAGVLEAMSVMGLPGAVLLASVSGGVAVGRGVGARGMAVGGRGVLGWSLTGAFREGGRGSLEAAGGCEVVAEDGWGKGGGDGCVSCGWVAAAGGWWGRVLSSGCHALFEKTRGGASVPHSSQTDEAALSSGLEGTSGLAKTRWGSPRGDGAVGRTRSGRWGRWGIILYCTTRAATRCVAAVAKIRHIIQVHMPFCINRKG